MSWLTHTFTAAKVLVASELSQFRENFSLLESHAHTGQSGDGSGVLDASSETGYPDDFSLPLELYHDSAPTLSLESAGGLGFSGLNCYAKWMIGLRVGIWRISFMTAISTGQGILRWSIDGALAAEFDLYSPTLTFVRRNFIFSIFEDKWCELEIRIADKNPASSNYFGFVYTPPAFIRLGD